MANPSALNLRIPNATFRTTYPQLTALKVNSLTRWTAADAAARAVQQWTNLIDDFVLAAQDTLELLATGSGSPQNSVAAVPGTVYLNREATPTGSRLWLKATGSGTTGWTQVGDLAAGSVALDRLVDAAALSVLGRAGTGTGVRADIASGGARRVLASNAGNTALAFRALEADDLPTISIENVDRVLYEVDFSTLANNTLANGAEVIDGLSWTVANVATLATAEVANGQGIRLLAGTSLGTNNTFNTTTRNAFHLWLPLSSLPGWDGRRDYLVEVYVSSSVLEQNGDSVFAGLWNAAGVPNASSTEIVKTARILNSSGTIVASSTNNATSTNGSNASTDNVLAVKVSGKGEGSALFGTWSSGWPAAMSAVTNFTAETGVVTPLNHSAMRIVMGLGVVDDASPTTAVVIRALRVSVV